MPSCAVASCKSTFRNKKTEGISFHKFPRDPKLCKIWKQKCKRKDNIDVKHAVICSKHFTTDQFELDLVNKMLNLKVRNKLKPGSCPTLELPLIISDVPDVIRSQRLKQRTAQRKDTHEVSSVEGHLDYGDDSHNQDSQSVDPDVAPFTSDVAIQTEKCNETKLKEKLMHTENLLWTYRKKVSDLRIKLAASRKRTKIVQNRMENLDNTKTRTLQQNITNIFSKSQLKILSGQQRVNWTPTDIAKSLSIASMSRSAYDTLRNIWNLPLPARRTLQRWASNFDCLPGVIPEILALMKAEATSLTSFQRLCVINFDEMKICSDVIYDASRDMIIGPHSQVQVIIANGLCMKWRQPLYYEFDQKVTKQILFQVIRELEAANYLVCAIVSDFGGTNRELWNELGVNSDSTNFENPVDTTRNVFVFADAPHMIKLIRNHVLDDGWVLEDGTLVDKETLEKLIEFDSSEIKLAPKLTHSLLEVKGSERMRVSSATKLLSNHTAALAKKCFPDHPAIYDFFKNMDDYFDIFNSRIPRDLDKHIRSGYGIFLTKQQATLDLVEQMVRSMRSRVRSKKLNTMIKRKALLPCQHGILASIRSLRGLHEMVKHCFNVTYIITRRINQDPLESFFSIIRSMGRTNENPSTASFRQRMKNALLGSKIKAPVGSNVIDEDDEPYYISAKLLEYLKDDKLVEDPAEETEIDEEIIPDTVENTKELEGTEFNPNTASLHYLAGYLAFALKRKFGKTYGVSTRTAETDKSKIPAECDSSWIEALSRGGLLIPNSMMITATEKCENTFKNMFGGDKVKDIPNISMVVRESIMRQNPDIDEDIVKSFTKIRLKIRIKLLNNHDEASGKRKFHGLNCRKNVKKTKQFCS